MPHRHLCVQNTYVGSVPVMTNQSNFSSAMRKEEDQHIPLSYYLTSLEVKLKQKTISQEIGKLNFNLFRATI